MFSQTGYKSFKSTLEPLVQECFVKKPTKENFMQNKYYIKKGLWEGTHNITYAYDREKVDSHFDDFLSLATQIPLIEKTDKKNSGILFCLDFLEDFNKRSIPQDEMNSQIFLANHFANFLASTQIARPVYLELSSGTFLAMEVNPRYRSLFKTDTRKPNGQEPGDR